MKNIITSWVERGDVMKTAFAQNLRKYRKICGMTQTALAKELHYSHTAIANYESGRNEPSLSDLCHLADVLGVSTDQLLGRDSKDGRGMNSPLMEQFLGLEPKLQKIIGELVFLL